MKRNKKLFFKLTKLTWQVRLVACSLTVLKSVRQVNRSQPYHRQIPPTCTTTNRPSDAYARKLVILQKKYKDIDCCKKGLLALKRVFYGYKTSSIFKEVKKHFQESSDVKTNLLILKSSSGVKRSVLALIRVC